MSPFSDLNPADVAPARPEGRSAFLRLRCDGPPETHRVVAVLEDGEEIELRGVRGVLTSRQIEEHRGSIYEMTVRVIVKPEKT